ncbi:unnamed protein product [Nippostrongylus brasiliensis]|uniref:Uncharacterized protein n=1 Tax=Nippostrongylus brasiliensis TaxID=27835 RepID=A0A158QX33_NIPBR|nr:unnamed protein product [Nippostrongylus brasiliensis]
MHRSPSWKSDENDVECRGVKVSGSVPGNPPLGASRYRTSDYRDSRAYDYTRRARHRNNDMDLYRMHQKEFDNVIHSRNVGGLLRQHSWSGSNMSLGSDRSRSSVSRDHRSSACSRQSDDADCGHIRSSNSHSVGTKLDEYDETKGTNLTYVAAGTAPVSTAVDDITSSASHLIFGQNGVDQRGTSAMRCNNVATSKMAKTISDMQAYAARQQLQNPSAYYCHHLEMERAALTLLNMMTAVQQPYVQQQRPASTVGRYIPELDCGDDAGAELAAGHQQQQANVAQLAGMLGAFMNGRAVSDTAAQPEPVGKVNERLRLTWEV